LGNVRYCIDKCLLHKPYHIRMLSFVPHSIRHFPVSPIYPCSVSWLPTSLEPCLYEYWSYWAGENQLSIACSIETSLDLQFIHMTHKRSDQHYKYVNHIDGGVGRSLLR